jgi:hypothetical protein
MLLAAAAVTAAAADVVPTRMQAHRARIAATMPGVSCDPSGPVYFILGPTAIAQRARLAERADLLVHFTAAGVPDEVRIESSSGDADVDANVARAVCRLAVVDDSDLAATRGPGWGRLSIRLRSA